MRPPNRLRQRLAVDEPLPETPMEPLHGWRGAPDEGRHTHCLICRAVVTLGDPVAGWYLEYVSLVVCEKCLADQAG
jgi:hypothetical protein